MAVGANMQARSEIAAEPRCPQARRRDSMAPRDEQQKGERMTRGKGWRLAAAKGRKRVLVRALLDTINLGRILLVIFSVPK